MPETTVTPQIREQLATAVDQMNAGQAAGFVFLGGGVYLMPKAQPRTPEPAPENGKALLDEVGARR